METLASYGDCIATTEPDNRPSSATSKLRKLAKSGVVTLVTATREVDGSHAAVLATLLKSR